MLRGDTDNNGAKNALQCDGSRSALQWPSHRAASGITPHCNEEVKSEECKVKSAGAGMYGVLTSSLKKYLFYN